MSMDLSKIADVREHAFFERKKRKSLAEIVVIFNLIVLLNFREELDMEVYQDISTISVATKITYQIFSLLLLYFSHII